MTTQHVSLSVVLLTVNGPTLLVYAPDGTLRKTQVTPRQPLDTMASDLIPLTKRGQWYQEQLYTYVYNKEVVISYLLLAPYRELTETQKVNCIPLSTLDSLKTFDKELISYAVQRLRWKVEYTNVVYSMLATQFTLSELQQIYEAILDRKLDKRNFRKKIFNLDILSDTGTKRKQGKARPAQVYRFKNRELTYVEIL